MNSKRLFDRLRLTNMFKGGFTQQQVNGINFIVQAFEDRIGKDGDGRWLAYMLATAYHETARTMQPIREIGDAAYFHRMYDPLGERPHVAERLGNTMPGDGVMFCGRGYVQLTGRSNYAKAAKLVIAPLLTKPDMAMQPKIAADIMLLGMRDGWFTGKSLADYFPKEQMGDWLQARRIINGMDCADKIALYASNFNDCIILSR